MPRKFNPENLYWLFGFLAAGAMAAALAGRELVAYFKLPYSTEGKNFYWLLLIGSQIGLFLYGIVQKRDDFVKRMVLLGFLIAVLAARQFLAWF
jgi:hypothetical protein